jgi:Predicted hydrolase of the alpha/beta superfamily
MRLSVLVIAGVLSGAVLAQQTPPLTPKSLQAALAAKPEGAEAEALAERIRAYFGGSEILLKGASPKIDELTVAWAVEAPQLAPNVTPRVMADAGALNVPMVKVGTSGLYAVAVNLSHGAALTWHYELGPDRRLGGSQIETYETPADSRERSDVPKGTVKQMPPWQSKIFEGTKRDWWVYVPAQYRPASPAAVMVFQDGAGPKDYLPTVFDNLIAKGDIPVMVGIFINPGTRADGGATAASSTTRSPISTRASCWRRSSRKSRKP